MVCVTAVLRASEGLAAGESGGSVDLRSVHGSNTGTERSSRVQTRELSGGHLYVCLQILGLVFSMTIFCHAVKVETFYA